MRKFKIFLAVVFILTLICVNIALTLSKSTEDDFSFSKIVLAKELVDPCYTTTFFPENMESDDTQIDCYDSEGKVCGLQRCCHYTEDPNSCNEHECIIL